MPEDFGERVAERFDERYAYQADRAVVDPMVAFLADLARGGAALELGIGTGRIALPLAQRGVAVHGIDLSEAIVARLRAKPGAERIGVWPAELDLMARLAGMTLRERWSGWNREPFTSQSTKHVSVWEKPAT